MGLLDRRYRVGERRQGYHHQLVLMMVLDVVTGDFQCANTNPR